MRVLCLNQVQLKLQSAGSKVIWELKPKPNQE
ncbi:hypothetical protein Trydic_g18450, partial [Trypoxylus dichotomus]